MAEVLMINTNMIEIHYRHGYDNVGIQRHHVYKNETWHDCVLLELRKDKWREQGFNESIGEFKF
jgi:L-amino acid N-acyltransferase YncA